jgi:hypothetical protein
MRQSLLPQSERYVSASTTNINFSQRHRVRADQDP